MGDVIGTVIMTFSSFGYYGQIWFNRNYTYECAVEEMPAGYADKMAKVIDNIPVLIIMLILVIPVAILAMRLAEKVMKKSLK